VPAGFEAVRDDSEIVEGQMLAISVMGHPLLLCRVRGRLYACSAECTYDEGADLGEGRLDGHTLTCPAHGCMFDVRSGRVIAPPAEEPLPTYEVRVEGGRVLVAHRPRGF
jgi:nitrite reductase/ring-hydroxylating ferredoxin subunit